MPFLFMLGLNTRILWDLKHVKVFLCCKHVYPFIPYRRNQTLDNTFVGTEIWLQKETKKRDQLIFGASEVTAISRCLINTTELLLVDAASL